MYPGCFENNQAVFPSSRCLNACTYCKTKHARGDLASYPVEELVERARQSFQGEWITAHTGSRRPSSPEHRRGSR